MPRGSDGPPPLVQRRQNSDANNVGARLLKKRQSVSYHHPNAPPPLRLDPQQPRVPAIPSAHLRSSRPPIAEEEGEEEPSRRYAPTAELTSPPPSASAATASSPVSPVAPREAPLKSPSAAFQSRQAADSALRGQTGFDEQVLASEHFKPEDFVRENLGGSTTDDLRELKQRLEAALELAEKDLEHTVSANYTDFVAVSKEMATLENEMLELKGALEEWRNVPTALEGSWALDDAAAAAHGPHGTPAGSSSSSAAATGSGPGGGGGGGGGGSARRNQRNSIADLASLYRSQLVALWENVEGAQKLVPATPGRHIIAESDSFIELNSATYKAKQQVHLFLLNDALLVSVKKRRGTGVSGKIKLVAERCFNLSEIVVVDLKDGGELHNAIKIKRSKESFIFKTDKADDKKVLLLAFKKIAEELSKKKRKEILNEAEARRTDAGATRGARPDYANPNSAFSPSDFLGLGGKNDPTGKDLSWVGDFNDELSVAIATRSFEDAVVLVEKGKVILPQLAGDAQATFLFRSKLDQRTSELVTVLLEDLSDAAIRKSGVVRATAWLLRLNQGERAREALLNSRGALVRRRARQIKFEGDISLYISELAIVCFTLIKNTCEWYMAAFKDNRMASGFVRWASEQVELFAETFRRQVYGVDQDARVIEESLEITRAHGAMLKDVGLDFTFLLDSLLQMNASNHPTQASAKGQRSSGRLSANQQQSAVALARQSLFRAA